MSAELIQFFFNLETNIKLYHWTTQSYPRHMATDKAHESLLALIDKFVEVYIGAHGRPALQGKSLKLSLRGLSDNKAADFLQTAIAFLREDMQTYVKPEESELWNIRDEMVAVLQQTLYLFTLN